VIAIELAERGVFGVDDQRRSLPNRAPLAASSARAGGGAGPRKQLFGSARREPGRGRLDGVRGFCSRRGES
jgi:hypothetical protein